MSSLRAFLRHYPVIGLLLVTAALILRFAVPSGYMPTFDHGRIGLVICTGTGPMPAMMATHGKMHEMPGKAGDDGKGGQPCAFAGLSFPSLAAADAVLLALALIFVMASGVRPLVPPALRRAAFLRPPLRGPPILG